MKYAASILFLVALGLFSVNCGGERKKCVRACAQAAIADLGICSNMEDPSQTEHCSATAKKKGRECLEACPK